MVRIGYTMMTEQAGLRELVEHVVKAERAGFGFSVICWRPKGTRPTRGQFPVSYDPDREAAVARAHDQFRWALGGWKANAELPGPACFAQASQHTRPEDVAEAIPCGDDQQEPFLDWSAAKLLPALGDL